MKDREIVNSVLSTEYLVLRLAGLTLNESAANITGTTKFIDNSFGVLVNSALNESAELNILGTEEIKFTGNGVGVKSSSLGVNNPSVVNVVGAIFENGAVGNNRGIELVNETRYFIQDNDFMGLDESIKVQATAIKNLTTYGNNIDQINCNRITSCQRGINVTGNNQITSLFYNIFTDNNQDVELLKIGAIKAKILEDQGDLNNPAANIFTSSNTAIKASSNQAVFFEYYYNDNASSNEIPNAMGQVYDVTRGDDDADACGGIPGGGAQRTQLQSEQDMKLQSISGKNSDDTDDFYIYPNPGANSLNIRLGIYSEHNGNLSLYTLQGKLLTKQFFNKGDIRLRFEVSQLKSGSYILVANSEGLESKVRKWVKL